MSSAYAMTIKLEYTSDLDPDYSPGSQDRPGRGTFHVLTCFLVITGDLTGLMGEMDSLLEGDTDLQRTTRSHMTHQSNTSHPCLRVQLGGVGVPDRCGCRAFHVSDG